MSKLLKHDWSDTSVPWEELDMQMAIAQTMRKAGVVFAADQNAGKRNKATGARLKAAGMMAGEPDLRFNLGDARVAYIELKTDVGRVSNEQRDRIALLRSMGHHVEVVWAETPRQAVNAVVEIVRGWLPDHPGLATLSTL